MLQIIRVDEAAVAHGDVTLQLEEIQIFITGRFGQESFQLALIEFSGSSVQDHVVHIDPGHDLFFRDLARR